MTDWKPISELTEEHKDGRTFMICCEDSIKPIFIRWSTINKCWEDDGYFGNPNILSEIWMFSEFKKPEFPKSQFIITEKDIGRKVILKNGRTAIIYAFLVGEREWAFAGFPDGQYNVYYKDDGRWMSSKESDSDISGWADESI